MLISALGTPVLHSPHPGSDDAPRRHRRSFGGGGGGRQPRSSDVSDPHMDIIQVWDARSGEPIASWRTSSGWGSVIFSADGTKVIGPDGKSICVWDAVTGAKLAEFTGLDSYGPPIAVFADGSRIVSGGESDRPGDACRGHGSFAAGE